MRDEMIAHRDLFEESLRIQPENFRGHMVSLALLAAQCHHVTEFGTSKGISTSAILLGRPHRLVTYDIARHERVGQLEDVARRVGVDFEFRLADTSKLQAIEATDMLFIDSAHVEDQLAAELSHAMMVGKWIAMHDTVTFAIRPEEAGRGRGLLFALLPFLRSNHERWELTEHHNHCNGFTVLRRMTGFPGRL